MYNLNSLRGKIDKCTLLTNQIQMHYVNKGHVLSHICVCMDAYFSPQSLIT